MQYGVIHADLRPDNIFVIPGDASVKIGGFMRMRPLHDTNCDYTGANARHGTLLSACLTALSGCVPYMSPERLLGLECSFPADVWSLGMSALECAAGVLPTGLNSSRSKAKSVVLAPTLLTGINGCSGDLRHFVALCLHRNPKERSTAAVMLQHAFLKRYDGKRDIYSSSFSR